jgi:hypothetical protein
MYVQRSTEACSCNQCCSGKTISIAHYEGVSVVVIIHHAMRIRRVMCHIWPVRFHRIFPHYLIKHTFSE